MLDAHEVTIWNGGKVHVIQKDSDGSPRVLRLMRGQVYEVEGKNIFVFGGGYSIDRPMRTPGKTWWPQEMPLNGFLEYIRQRTDYAHWYFGHLHRDEDTWRNQTVLLFSVRNMEDNNPLTE